MKNRTIIGIICIALAAALMFCISPLVTRLSTEEISVVQVNKTISEGSMITNNDVITVKIGKNGAPKNVIQDSKDVVGKYAKTDIYKGLNLIPDLFTTDASNSDTVFETLDDKHVAISITIPSFAAGLSSKLENGDIVRVLVSDGLGTRVPEELKYVRVITTTTSTGIDKDDLQVKEDGTYDLPSTVTLYVSPEQANLLAEYENNSTMHLTLVHRGNDETSQKYLDMQDAILQDLLVQDGGEVNE